MEGYTVGQRILMGFELCFSLVPPKILFTYFIFYIIFKRVLKENRIILSAVLLTLLALAILLFIERAIATYISYPAIFNWRETSYWNAFGFLFGIIDIGFIAGIAITIKLIRFQFMVRERENLLIREKLETELKYLKNQTSPHFLFNTLNNIYSFSLNQSPLAGTLVKKLSGMLDYMIHECEEKFVPLEKELRLIQDYLGLEKVRYGKRLDMQIEIHGDFENKFIAPLLMIPFVENSFKHGTSQMLQHPWIRLEISTDAGLLIFKLSNSKPSLNSKKLNNGIGLLNVQKRLQLLYPDDHQLNINSTEETFIVEMQIMLSEGTLKKIETEEIIPDKVFTYA